MNLMAAWRGQLLEVLGAMGMRGVRCLRGETSRAIFYQEEEKHLRSLFLLRRKELPIARLPPGFPEGDLRWTPELLQATHIQAEMGRLPELDIEVRVGCSGGGFDRLRFVFEQEDDEMPFEENEGLGLSLIFTNCGTITTPGKG